LKNDSNILAGIDTASQTWVAGAFAGTIANASTYDVIKVGKTQLENSGENNAYSPNVVLMNPTDYTAMMLTKTTDGQYLYPMYMQTGEMAIDGMTIMTSSLVTQDTLYIMDSSKGTIYNLRGLSIDMASEHEDDFLHDRIRLRAILRKAFLIRNVNANAFLKVDSIAGAIALL
jgi:HK97 family phage major capsid protein